MSRNFPRPPNRQRLLSFVSTTLAAVSTTTGTHEDLSLVLSQLPPLGGQPIFAGHSAHCRRFIHARGTTAAVRPLLFPRRRITAVASLTTTSERIKPTMKIIVIVRGKDTPTSTSSVGLNCPGDDCNSSIIATFILHRRRQSLRLLVLSCPVTMGMTTILSTATACTIDAVSTIV
ncbi:hypothetical protein IW262DRAFT_1481669, partial [Armillaria fumosa]